MIEAITSSAQVNFNLCQRDKALSNLTLVQENAKTLLITSDDNCVLLFLDTLTNGFIICNNTRYITTLNAICKVSDGYVSEYFWEVVEKIAYKSFPGFSNYMTENEESCLEQVLLKIMNTEIRREDMTKRIDEELTKNISSPKKSFLNKLKANLSQ